MTNNEKKAYSRGYYAGSSRRWPDYHPPAPPDPLAAEIMKASVALANSVANWCGMFGDEDEFSKELRPLLEAVDAANAKVTAWLQQPQREDHGT